MKGKLTHRVECFCSERVVFCRYHSYVLLFLREKINIGIETKVHFSRQMYWSKNSILIILNVMPNFQTGIRCIFVIMRYPKLSFHISFLFSKMYDLSQESSHYNHDRLIFAMAPLFSKPDPHFNINSSDFRTNSSNSDLNHCFFF